MLRWQIEAVVSSDKCSLSNSPGTCCSVQYVAWAKKIAFLSSYGEHRRLTL